MKRFVYKVFYSDEDECYVATCEQFPSLSWLADTAVHALDGMVSLAAQTLEDLREEKVEELEKIASEYDASIRKGDKFSKILEYLLKNGNKCLCNKASPCPCKDLKSYLDTDGICKCGLFEKV